MRIRDNVPSGFPGRWSDAPPGTPFSLNADRFSNLLRDNVDRCEERVRLPQAVIAFLRLECDLKRRFPQLPWKSCHAVFDLQHSCAEPSARDKDIPS